MLYRCKRVFMQSLHEGLVRSGRSLAHAAAGAIAALMLAGTAQAAVYTGAWDPAFGDDFPDLGWRGEASFYIPDACLALDGLVFNFNSCSGNQMQILEAEVEFYKLSDPTNPAFQETLSFDVPSFGVLAMILDDGMLTGVLGSFLYSVSSTLPLAGGPYTDFVLFFENDLARLAYHSDPPKGKDRWGFSDPNPPDGAPLLTFRPVPEPGAWVVLVGLLALVALQWRRKAAPARAARWSR